MQKIPQEYYRNIYSDAWYSKSILKGISKVFYKYSLIFFAIIRYNNGRPLCQRGINCKYCGYYVRNIQEYIRNSLSIMAIKKESGFLSKFLRLPLILFQIPLFELGILHYLQIYKLLTL